MLFCTHLVYKSDATNFRPRSPLKVALFYQAGIEIRCKAGTVHSNPPAGGEGRKRMRPLQSKWVLPGYNP